MVVLFPQNWDHLLFVVAVEEEDDGLHVYDYYWIVQLLVVVAVFRLTVRLLFNMFSLVSTVVIRYLGADVVAVDVVTAVA